MAAVWRNIVYSDEADNCMSRLFKDELKFFDGLKNDIPKKYTKSSIIEVGFGTAELFNKIVDKFDLLVGVELSQAFVNLAYELHSNLRERKDKSVFLEQGNAMEMIKVLSEGKFGKDHDLWKPTTHRLLCMCMNTLGIIPEVVRNAAINEMFKVAGPGGKVVLGCWNQPSLRTGYNDFYSKNPALTSGQCKIEDFDFENGNFNCSVSDYTSHWFSKAELTNYLTKNFDGKAQDITITFKVCGVGIFAVAEIAEAAEVAEVFNTTQC